MIVTVLAGMSHTPSARAQVLHIGPDNIQEVTLLGGPYRLACWIKGQRVGRLSAPQLTPGANLRLLNTGRLTKKIRKELKQIRAELLQSSQTQTRSKLRKAQKQKRLWLRSLMAALEACREFQNVFSSSSSHSSLKSGSSYSSQLGLASSSASTSTANDLCSNGIVDPGEVGIDCGGNCTRRCLAPIARWDTVPYQRISAHQNLNVGVVAFSKDGIDRVEFTVNAANYRGANPLIAREMTYNPQTQVYEYWFPLAADDFDKPGNLQIEAVVFGKDGGVRDKNTRLDVNPDYEHGLDPLRLVANPIGTLPRPEAWVALDGNDTSGAVGNSNAPFASIVWALKAIQDWRNSHGYGNNADGGIVHLKPGSYLQEMRHWYDLPNAYENHISVDNEWVTITTAEGGDKTNTRLSAPWSIMNVLKVKIQGITIDRSMGRETVVSPNSIYTYTQYVWLDDVDIIGAGRWISRSNPVGIAALKYWTNCRFSNVNDAIPNWTTLLARNVLIEHIGDNALENVPLVVNVKVDDMDPKYPLPPVSEGRYYAQKDIGGTVYSHVVEKAGAFENFELNPYNESGDNFYITYPSNDNFNGWDIDAKISADAISLKYAFAPNDVDLPRMDGYLATGWHADAWQWVYGIGVPNGAQENTIVYGFQVVNSTYQALSDNSWHSNPVPADNIAFVNLYLGPNTTSYHARETNNMLMWHVTARGEFSFWPDDVNGPKLWSPVKNISLKGCSFYRLNDYYPCGNNHGQYGLVDWSGAEHNHYEVAAADCGPVNPGSDFTTGNPGYDEQGRPAAGSVLLDRVQPVLVPIDAAGTPRGSPADVGAYEKQP